MISSGSSGSGLFNSICRQRKWERQLDFVSGFGRAIVWDPLPDKIAASTGGTYRRMPATPSDSRAVSRRLGGHGVPRPQRTPLRGEGHPPPRRAGGARSRSCRQPRGAQPVASPDRHGRVADPSRPVRGRDVSLRVLLARQTTMRDGTEMAARLVDDAPDAILAINDAMAVPATIRLRRSCGCSDPSRPPPDHGEGG